MQGIWTHLRPPLAERQIARMGGGGGVETETAEKEIVGGEPRPAQARHGASWHHRRRPSGLGLCAATVCAASSALAGFQMHAIGTGSSRDARVAGNDQPPRHGHGPVPPEPATRVCARRSSSSRATTIKEATSPPASASPTRLACSAGVVDVGRYEDDAGQRVCVVGCGHFFTRLWIGKMWSPIMFGLRHIAIAGPGCNPRSIRRADPVGPMCAAISSACEGNHMASGGVAFDAFDEGLWHAAAPQNLPVLALFAAPHP